jgi:hypothetical protein
VAGGLATLAWAGNSRLAGLDLLFRYVAVGDQIEVITDTILIGITFLAGIIGTLWERPPKFGKIALIVLLLASSVAAIVKAFSDDKDKELLQNLAIAGLALPNSAYSEVYEQMDKAYPDDEWEICHHSSQGMTCRLKPVEGKPARTFVFNRYELAQVYADAVRGRDRDTKRFLLAISEKHYDPKQLGDEYQDKLGILGIGTFYDMCRQSAADYAYDDNFGVKIFYSDQEQEIVLTPDEVKKPEANLGPVLFGHFDELFRTKIHQALPSCPERAAQK